MRWMVAAVIAGMVTGCASTTPPMRATVHRAPRPAQSHAQSHPQSQSESATAKPHAPAVSSTPVKLDAPTPRPQGPGANIPLEGFRPMRSPSRPDA